MVSPIFIVGHERSGTTLMAALFDRHSRIAITPETHFFTDVVPAEIAAQATDPQSMVHYLFRGARMRDLRLCPDELFNRIAGSRPTWAELFHEALKLYAHRHGKEIPGEKTPNHWRDVPLLLDLYPHARIIWMVRDGRDTVASLMNVPWRQHSNMGLHALNWRHTVDRMLEFESRFAGRILRVRFEDLILAPQEELQRAGEFVGIDFEPAQLDPTHTTHVVPQWEMRWKCRVFQPLDPSRIGAAARELSAESLQMLTVLTAPGMQKLGYEIAQIHPAQLRQPMVA